MSRVVQESDTVAISDVKPSWQALSNVEQNVALTGVVVLGCDFQALGVMRALQEAKIPGFLVATEFGIARYSRSVNRACYNIDIHCQHGVEQLCQLAESENLQGWVVACVDDDTVEFLARNHARLSQYFLLPVPAWETTQKFFEKDRCAALARDCGLPTPISYQANDLEQLLEQELTYPLVLKPTFKKNFYPETKTKGILVQGQDDLRNQYTAMRKLIPSSQIVVQEYLAGGPKNLFSYAALFDGQEMVQGMAVNRLRQHPMDFGHATTYAKVVDLPVLEEYSAKLLRALEYRGVAEVEFMFDERTQEYKLLEMNGRFWGWHSLTHAAGLNLPRDLFRMLNHLDIARDEINLASRWARVLTDMPTILQESFRGKLSFWKSLSELVRASGFAVWSWRDPLPFVVEVLIAPYLWWKKGF